MTRTPKGNFRFASIFTVVLTLTSACSSTQPVAPTEKAEVAVEQKALSQAEATQRFNQIAFPSYTLWFGLDSKGEQYQGRAVIQFDLKDQANKASSDVFIDFYNGAVQTVTVNHVQIEKRKVRYDGNRLWFAVKDLASGRNRIEIAFSRDYSKNGAGLHRFKDPVDGRVYIYSNFEPYDARQMFPCFDQPDLKASYELTVEAPEDWTVIANTRERDVADVDGRKSWSFPASAEMSTYLFALHAGPYAEWKADADGVPLRLFARKSLAQYVDHKEWLLVTQQGLKWFSKIFDYPYPFTKYDQVIVPDFNAGAMENIAAVTFSERMVYRSKATVDRHEARANTILHEMAHMWFGDLVTMKWWNGLWLNESFATFMATWAIDQATSFKGSWQAFTTGTKDWAYWEDQLVTTHPIEAQVPATDQAFANFDGITYGKGASSLKQLMYFLGEDQFIAGVRKYFKNHAYKNTTIDDFVGSLVEASGRDLSQWKRLWLETSGLSTLEPVWQCANGKISQFTLKQSPGNGDSVLRPHRTQIAFYKSQQGRLKLSGTIKAEYSLAETPIPEAIGRECPALVHPNAGDYDYVKLVLDPVSLNTAQSQLSTLPDSMSRQMIWGALWEMVRDSKLSAQKYLDIVYAQSAREPSTQILSFNLNKSSSVRQKYLSPEWKESYTTRGEEFLKRGVRAAAPGSDLQLIWFQSYAANLTSTEGTQWLKDLLSGKRKIALLKFDQERRWEAIQALARNNEAANLIDLEEKKDATDMGKKAAIQARAAIPTRENKDQWMATLLGGKLKLSDARRAMRSFFSPGQEALTSKYSEDFFRELPKMSKTLDEGYVDSFSDSMFPSLCDAAVITGSDTLLKNNSGLPAYLLKNIKVGKQEEERCLNARKVSAQEKHPHSG